MVDDGSQNRDMQIIYFWPGSWPNELASYCQRLNVSLSKRYHREKNGTLGWGVSGVDIVLRFGGGDA